MSHTKISDVTDARASINPSRLHLLLSATCGVVALAYGIYLLTAEYPPFASNFTERRHIQAIERETGKPYAEWKNERAIYCSKHETEIEDSGGGVFAFDPQGQRELLFEACMNGISAEDIVPNGEIRTAFMKAAALPALAYAGGTIVAAWLIGFLFARAIPIGSKRLWRWLTSNEKTVAPPRMPEFFDVEGIPVSLGNMPGDIPSCAAWDVTPPRPFDPGSARRNGTPISMSEFLPLLSPEALAFIQLTLPSR